MLGGSCKVSTSTAGMHYCMTQRDPEVKYQHEWTQILCMSPYYMDQQVVSEHYTVNCFETRNFHAWIPMN